MKSVLDSIATHVTNIKGSGADIATLKDIVNAITSNGAGGSGGASVLLDVENEITNLASTVSEIKTQVENIRGV